MLIVLPICRHDLHLSFDLLDAIKKLDGKSLKRHEVLLLCRPSSESAMIALVEEYDKLFGGISFEVLPDEGPEGWPDGANDMFIQVSKIVQGFLKENKGHWLWVDPDCVPTCSEWVDAIDMQIRASGKHYMGCVIDTGDDGRHMNGGCLVLPWNASSELNADTMQRQEAWDFQARKTILSHGESTELIQSLYRSTSFRKEGDLTLCDCPPETNNTVNVTRQLGKNTVILHGCKDGSLKRLLFS